jgi:Protein of unknown function (DUF3551)
MKLHRNCNALPSSALRRTALLSLLFALPASAQAEGSWCVHKSGTGSANCGFYSFQQCSGAVSGGSSFCTQNGAHQNYPARRTRGRR